MVEGFPLVVPNKKGAEKLPTIGTSELIIILIVVLIIFGAGRLPKMGRDIGRGLREFREGISLLSRDENQLPKEKNTGSQKN